MENSKILRRYGEWVARHKWLSISTWLVVLAGVAFAFLTYGTNYSSNLSVSNLPSMTVADKISDVFGQKQDNGSIRIVLEAKDGQKVTDPAEVQRVNSMLEDVQKADKHITAVANPYQSKTISRDLTTLFADVTFNEKVTSVSVAQRDKVKNIAKKLTHDGYKVTFTGNLSVAPAVDGSAEAVGMVIALILLLILLGRVVAAGLPLVSALFGLGVSIMGFGLSTQFFDITSTALSLATMLGLAVGIDYGLFVLHRYREVARTQKDVPVAIGMAVGSAGSAVVFAGVTVIVAVLGLSLIGFDFMTQMGIAAAVAALFAVLSAVTLMPALISLLSKWILPKHEKVVSDEPNTHGKLLAKAPWLFVIAALAVLITAALPAGHMRFGMPTDGEQIKSTTQRQAYDTLSEKFGEGFNSQLVVLAKVADTSQVQTIYKKISAVKNVNVVTAPQVKDGYALLVAIPKHGPNDASTQQVVKDIRALKIDGAKLGVAGTAAVNIDVVDKLTAAMPKFAGLIMWIAFVLLMLVYRSLLIPLVAMLGFGLSLLAALGVVTTVVQDGTLQDVLQFSGKAPILAFLPVIVIGVLFGLAMDYEVFLMSRIHEAYQETHDNKTAVLHGLKAAGPVIVTAALIMFAVFISFVFTSDPIIKSMGLALAVGVFFDAFIVRLILVPALTLLFGKANWWFFGK